MSVSGKYLTAYIGDFEIYDNYAWEATEGGDVLERTTGAHGGYAAEDMGVYDCHITIKGFMDVEWGLYIPVQRGTEIEDLALYRHNNDVDPAYLFPFAIVVNSRQGGEVNGKVEWNAEIHSWGPYTCNDPESPLAREGNRRTPGPRRKEPRLRTPEQRRHPSEAERPVTSPPTEDSP